MPVAGYYWQPCELDNRTVPLLCLLPCCHESTKNHEKHSCLNHWFSFWSKKKKELMNCHNNIWTMKWGTTCMRTNKETYWTIFSFVRLAMVAFLLQQNYIKEEWKPLVYSCNNEKVINLNIKLFWKLLINHHNAMIYR